MKPMLMRHSILSVLSLFLGALLATEGLHGGPRDAVAAPVWTAWHRPADNPVFTAEHGNNHDSILFVEPQLEYPYHLIISHWESGADLWRAREFSWSSAGWELVSDEYQIGGQYEYDDGVKVGDTYYIYEDGHVYTYSGPLEEASGAWIDAGTFPVAECDDIGVYYEDGVFHIFGEYGDYPHGPDGTSLSHFVSTTGLGDWQLVNSKAADPNPDGGQVYGVGDPTIARIQGEYYIFCDLESENRPYEVIAWSSSDINQPFEYLGVAIEPRRDDVDDWDNYRIQDPDIGFVAEQSRYVMTCNMMDTDGNPGGDFPNLPPGFSRVIGVFYSTCTLNTIFWDGFEDGEPSSWSSSQPESRH
jgi:hypothetical protein